MLWKGQFQPKPYFPQANRIIFTSLNQTELQQNKL